MINNFIIAASRDLNQYGYVYVIISYSLYPLFSQWAPSYEFGLYFIGLFWLLTIKALDIIAGKRLALTRPKIIWRN